MQMKQYWRLLAVLLAVFVLVSLCLPAAAWPDGVSPGFLQSEFMAVPAYCSADRLELRAAQDGCQPVSLRQAAILGFGLDMLESTQTAAWWKDLLLYVVALAALFVIVYVHKKDGRKRASFLVAAIQYYK